MPALELERFLGLQHRRTLELEVGAGGLMAQRLQRSFPEEGGVLELGDVELAPGGALHGRVVDASGLGVEGALVVFGGPIVAEAGDGRAARRGPTELRAPGGRTGNAVAGRSGPGGAFRLDGVAAGHGTAWARTETSLWAVSEPRGQRAGTACPACGIRHPRIERWSWGARGAGVPPDRGRREGVPSLPLEPCEPEEGQKGVDGKTGTLSSVRISFAPRSATCR